MSIILLLMILFSFCYSCYDLSKGLRKGKKDKPSA